MLAGYPQEFTCPRQHKTPFARYNTGFSLESEVIISIFFNLFQTDAKIQMRKLKSFLVLNLKVTESNYVWEIHVHNNMKTGN